MELVVYKTSSRSDLGVAFPCDPECVFSHLNKTNASVDVLEVGVRKKGQATVLVGPGVLDKPGRCWKVTDSREMLGGLRETLCRGLSASSQEHRSWGT